MQEKFAGTGAEPYINNPNAISTNVMVRTKVVYYSTKAGDTVGSVARKYGISSDTIRWANNISGTNLLSGAKLKILPTTGVEHKVVRGDTPAKLARHYGSNASLIISFNDAELSGLRVGSTIIIPDGKKPATITRRFVVSSVFRPSGVSYGGNGYSYGYCTYGVAIMRAAIGRPLPMGLGNANAWYYRAQSMGMKTGTKPASGAVLWHVNPIRNPLGHVAFVQKLNADGSILVVDMNYRGWNVFSTRVIQPSDFYKYRFIY